MRDIWCWFARSFNCRASGNTNRPKTQRGHNSGDQLVLVTVVTDSSNSQERNKQAYKGYKHRLCTCRIGGKMKRHR